MGIPFEQRNFQKELDKKIAGFQKDGIVPTLLLHSCCAPCSSHCIEYLSDYFHITVFYYNPNISAEEEYRKRVEEQKRFFAIKLLEKDDKIKVLMKNVPDVSVEIETLEKEFDDDTESIITNERYTYKIGRAHV